MSSFGGTHDVDTIGRTECPPHNLSDCTHFPSFGSCEIPVLTHLQHRLTASLHLSDDNLKSSGIPRDRPSALIGGPALHRFLLAFSLSSPTNRYRLMQSLHWMVKAVFLVCSHHSICLKILVVVRRSVLIPSITAEFPSSTSICAPNLNKPKRAGEDRDSRV
jgi:hypothetical protein